MRTLAAEQIHADLIESVKDQIKEVECEIRRLIDSDEDLRHSVTLLCSVPGIGLLTAATLAAMSNCFTEELRCRPLAAHWGGTSVRGPARSRGYRPLRLRMLLRLASWSLRKYNPEIGHYFERKKAEGKASTLIYNHIANKLLRRAISTLKSGKPYSPDYLAEKSMAFC